MWLLPIAEEYLDKLIEKKIVSIQYEHMDEVEEGSHGSMEDD